MEEPVTESIEARFYSLSKADKISVIAHGATLLLAEWKKRLFLAESKVRHFEEKYHIDLAHIEEEGLPDDADVEMHEDYIAWRHWTDASLKAKGCSGVQVQYP